MRVLIFAVLSVAIGYMGCGGITSSGGVKGSGNVKSETRNLTGFKKIKAENGVEVTVAVQKAFGVTIRADDNLLPNITSEVQGDTLVVGLKGNVNPKTKVTIEVTMPELTALDLVGAVSCTVSGVKTDELKVNAAGASKVSLNGQATAVTAHALGASNIDAAQLKSSRAEADAEGASTVVVAATDDLDAKASGASTVAYVGQPAKIERSAKDVSSIKQQ